MYNDNFQRAKRPDGSGGGQPAGTTLGSILRGIGKMALGNAVGGAGGQAIAGAGNGGNQTFDQPAEQTYQTQPIFNYEDMLKKEDPLKLYGYGSDPWMIG